MRVSLLLYILNCNFKNYSSPLPPACWNGVWDNLLFLKNAGGWRTVFLSWKPHVLIFADRCCSKARGTSSVPLRVWHQALAISVLRAPVENLRLDVESRALEKIYLIFFLFFWHSMQHVEINQKWSPNPLLWKSIVLATGPPGKSQDISDFESCFCHLIFWVLGQSTESLQASVYSCIKWD